MLSCFPQTVVKLMRGKKYKLNPDRIGKMAIPEEMKLLLLDGDCSDLVTKLFF